MNRKKQKKEYTLNSGNITSLSKEEIVTVLRAVDEVIATGGRSMLTKILKGSKDKKLLGHNLNGCPSYGFYADLTIDEICMRVDWLIKERYIRIEYQGRLPCIVFTDKGWEIEKETFAEELFQEFRKDTQREEPQTHLRMDNVNRQVILRILDKICDTNDTQFLPILNLWKRVEVRKVREKITEVERMIAKNDK